MEHGVGGGVVLHFFYGDRELINYFYVVLLNCFWFGPVSAVFDKLCKNYDV